MYFSNARVAAFTCPFQTNFSDAIEICDGRDCETVVVCRRIRRSLLEGVGRKEDRLGIGWARGGAKDISNCLNSDPSGRIG